MKTTNTDYRRRLLDGLASALDAKSYRDITLADIAAEARVSRRTFYEQFGNKDQCLIALGEQTSDAIMVAINDVYSADKAWPELVTDITRAYLSLILAHPRLMRALYIELAALGDAGVQMRRKVAERFARFLQQQVDLQRERGADLRPLTLPLSMALVAGTNELILFALSEPEGAFLDELPQAAAELVHRVTSGAG